MAKGKQMAFRGGISELMKQAHRIQTKLEKVKTDIKEQSWTAEAAGGKVKITINGAKEVTGLEIDKALIDPAEIETLNDVLISAINAAISLAEERIEAATEEATGGLRIPGMF
jgi:DNA-binding YbaB/EbfC family protein